MKKLLSILLSFIMTFGIITSLGKNAEFQGEGTKAKPYLISGAEELYLLSEKVYKGESFEGKYFLLTKDIALNETDDFNLWQNRAPQNKWTPIGGPNFEFSGVFDGGNHEISGIYINSENRNYAGLFGYVHQGEIKNLKITKSFIKAGDNTGILSGSLVKSKASGIEVSGIVLGKNQVGSVTGNLYKSTLSVIKSDADIEGGYYSGGIVGKTFDSIIDSAIFKGFIKGEKGVGGIAGNSEKTEIKNTYETSSVIGEEFVGGISGHNDEESKIFASYSLGDIKGESAVGGIAGLNYGIIESCYTKSRVEGELSGAIAGINSPEDEEDEREQGEIINTYYAVDKTENAVGYTDNPDELDIVGLKAERLTLSYISSFIFEGEYISEEDRVKNPDNVWDFSDKKGPKLFFESELKYDEPIEKPDVTGEKIGEIVSTDIRAYINGSEIKAYNIGGKMAIALKDLREFGFTVTFNEVKREVKVSYNGGEINSSFVYEEDKLPVGTYLKDILSTDIKAYIKGEETESFNADGYTHVYFRSLSSFGEVTFDENERRAELFIK